MFEKGVSHEIAESGWLHGFIFLKGVQVNLIFHFGSTILSKWVQCLNVCSESTETHEDVILHFENSLEFI